MENIYKETHLLWLAKLEELPSSCSLRLRADRIHSPRGEIDRNGILENSNFTHRTESWEIIFWEQKIKILDFLIPRISFNHFDLKNCFDFKK